MDNKAIAALFREMGELLDIQGGDQYRARTFRRVSHIIEELPEPVEESLAFGRLQRRRGVGDGTIARIKVILRTGTCRDLLNTRPVDELLQLRHDRMRKLMIQVPARPAPTASPDDRLPGELASQPLSDELCLRLETWLHRPDDDPLLTDTLAELSDNPVRHVFELLWRSGRQPE